MEKNKAEIFQLKENVSLLEKSLKSALEENSKEMAGKIDKLTSHVTNFQSETLSTFVQIRENIESNNKAIIEKVTVTNERYSFVGRCVLRIFQEFIKWKYR